MNKALIFFFGAAVGSAATYFAVKGKFEQEAQDAINEEREFYKKKCSELSQNKPMPIGVSANDISAEKIVKSEKETAEVIESLKEKNEALGYSRKEEPSMSSYVEPYEISLDEYTTLNGYAKEILTMYPNDILADENYELVDVADTIGFDTADRLPDRENAEIYIRNDRQKVDYTLIRETQSYEEITGIFMGGYDSDDYDE